jgi:hypothetical protein
MRRSVFTARYGLKVLCIIQVKFCLQRPWHGSGRPFTSEARVRSQVSRCEICAEQGDAQTGFAPSTSVSPRHCHSTNAPHSSSSTPFSYQKDKREKPGNLKKWRPFGCEELWLEKYFQFFALKGLGIWYFYWRRHVFCYVGPRYCNFI